jgi:hypothetical protein
MESLKVPVRNSVRKNSMQALKVMKVLSAATSEDLKKSSSLSVTYVDIKKKARIVKCDKFSENSTDADE